MIFEKLEYQQECIDNILELLESFDFKSLKTKLPNAYNDEINNFLGEGGNSTRVKASKIAKI